MPVLVPFAGILRCRLYVFNEINNWKTIIFSNVGLALLCAIYYHNLLTIVDLVDTKYDILFFKFLFSKLAYSLDIFE